MGVPSRFASEYPKRALKLIHLFERRARQSDLLGTFGLLAAAAVLTIPYERMKPSHFLHDAVRDDNLAKRIKELEKIKFFKAPFWRDECPGKWKQSRIMGFVDEVDKWRDEKEQHPFAENANTIQSRKADQVIRVLRNALAHGNVIYLDREGRELAGNQMVYMAFLSRYEETDEQREKAETYRVVIISAEEFLRFVKLWAIWVSSFQLVDRVLEEVN